MCSALGLKWPLEFSMGVLAMLRRFMRGAIYLTFAMIAVWFGVNLFAMVKHFIG